MKISFSFIFQSLALIILNSAMNPNSLIAQSLNVATYNIRFDNPNDEGNLWKDRAPHLINQILFHQMDVIGTQEGLFHQLEEMKAALNYPYVGVGRDHGGEEGEFSAIFYNDKKIILLENDTFWLSDTPDEPSKGWDAALNRVCTWAKFQTEQGDEFYVFNVHYDHIGQLAREESSKLVLEKISAINTNSVPVIFMGDFNVNEENPAYKQIENHSFFSDSRKISKLPSFGNQGTFNAFDWNNLPQDIIDHIFVSSGISVIRHGILTDNYGKKYPSDHFPVLAEIKFYN